MDSPNAIIQLSREMRRSPDARYSHRLHAVLLVCRGMSRRKVARLLGDSPRAVAYWTKRFDEDGLSGLSESVRSGRPTRLQPDHIDSIRQVLNDPPSNHGIRGNRWNGKNLGNYIEARFNIRLGIRQCQRLIKNITDREFSTEGFP